MFALKGSPYSGHQALNRCWHMVGGWNVIELIRSGLGALSFVRGPGALCVLAFRLCGSVVTKGRGGREGREGGRERL